MSSPTPGTGQPDTGQQPAESVDLKPVEAALAAALAALLLKWALVKAAWVTELVGQVGAAIADRDLARFGRLALDSTHAASIVQDAMTGLATISAAHVVSEAAAQGTHGVQPVVPATTDIADQASVAAALLAAALATSAGAEAVRVHRPGPPDKGGSTQASTTAAVRKHLESLSDAQPEYVLGGALHGAQNAARILTLTGAGIDVAVFASEVNDTHICVHCAEIHGRRLKDFGSDDWSQVHKAYPVRGYINCLGRDRCRGTVIGVWQKENT